jgi:hypothetical protein
MGLAMFLEMIVRGRGGQNFCTLRHVDTFARWGMVNGQLHQSKEVGCNLNSYS